jgi:hypothetical protein
MKKIHASILINIILIIAIISANALGKSELNQEEARKALKRLSIPMDKITFYNAVSNNDEVITSLFLLAGMSPNTLIPVGDSAVTPLILSSYNDNIKMVKLFIDKGADINYMCTLKPNEERTALYYAIQKLNYDVCKLLLEKGAHTYFINHGKIYTGKELLEKMIAKKEYVSSKSGTQVPMDKPAHEKALQLLDLLKKYPNNDLITLTGKVSTGPKGWVFVPGDQSPQAEGYRLGEKFPDVLRGILEQAKNQNVPVTISGELDREGYIYINKINLNEKQYSIPNYRAGN